MVQNSFDNILKDKFSNFQPEPPSYIWDNIQAELAATEEKKKIIPLFQRNGIRIALPFVAASIIALVYFVFSPQHNGAPTHNTPNVIAVDSNTNSIQIDSQQIIEESKNIYSENKTTNTSSPADTVDNTSFEEENRSTIDKKNKNSKHIEYPGKENSPINFTTIISDFDDVIAAIDNIHPTIEKREINKLRKEEKHSNSYFDYAFNSLGDLKNWELGLYAFPGSVHHSKNSLTSSSNYNFDFAVIYSTSQFLIQSGLSYTAGNDNNNIDIKYKQLETIGSYNDVYDVEFDSINGQVVPTYFTNEVTVYDSVQHSTITKLNNSYKYLSVPLLIGYRNNIGSDFTLKLSTGPIISMIISDNQTYDFNNEGAQIISINNNLGERAAFNWQLMFSAGLEYKLNHFASIAIEPTIKYNINNIYENALHVNRPYSLGIRTGLVFDF
ncbi:MAG: hypothetical protein U9R32_02885 [Bacteroidota bacterium]|nr:hypothetical protein [Bacteroidota bacterium]